MKTKLSKRIASVSMAILMLVAIMPTNLVVTKANASEENTKHEFDAKGLNIAAEGTYTDGQEVACDDYFTVVASKKTKVESKVKTFDDGYKSTNRVNFGGRVDLENNKDYVRFKTNSEATVKIWWGKGGDDARQMAIYDLSDNSLVAKTDSDVEKNGLEISTLKISKAGLYALGGDIGKNYIMKIEVTEGEAKEVTRADWSTVANPEITKVTDNNDGTITVDFNAVVGANGGDKVVITVKDSNGSEQKATSLEESASGSKNFTLPASDEYSASVELVREGENTKLGGAYDFNFVLPLVNPTINSATSTGNGTVTLDWSEVVEADSYIVSYSNDGENYTVAKTDITDTEYKVSDLTVGEKYRFKVQAVRNTPKAETEGTISDEVEITSEEQTVWGVITYGNGANKDNFKKSGDINKIGSVQLTAGKLENGKLCGKGNDGKLVPASFDGLSFYYTEIPSDKNFTLRAKVNVDQWWLSNGQEGFGLMAADQLGGSGWNNSYMAVVSKTEFFADSNNEYTTDTTAKKVSHKIGIASQEKIGVTADNIKKMEANDTSVINSSFKTAQLPLELRYQDESNLIGNYANEKGVTSNANITEMYLTIQKNNTGYFVTYESADGSYKKTNKYYDTESLSQIDKDSVYAGFFVSRYAQVTFSDVTLNIVDSKDDAPKEERPVETIETVTTIDSAKTSNSSAYDLKFNANADGKAVVYQNGQVIKTVDVKANEQLVLRTSLSLGDNQFAVKFKPDGNFRPGEYKKMSSLEERTISQTVSYNAYNGDIIYVAANASGSGSKEDPADLQTAIRFAQPGQTIVVKAGTYSYKSTLEIPRGTNGSKDKMIKLVADPETPESRPVISGANASGHAMEIAGDYWYIEGIDVAYSANAKDGIHLSGNHNVIDNVETYHNGNTGLQISRLSAADTDKSMWPSYNLILNCTSYANADAGYEDADGFAAKLTCGDGNVFDGCISHNNADDGWDLFAKVQSGAIGVVTIKNSVAYANGYLEDGTDAGNGNGFKMGGDSMTGYHVLDNCVAFDNKSKGIDSNSCPDIQISNSTSFNNEANNVALYTNSASNTDYSASGILSFRTNKLTNGENIKLKGSQNTGKVYQESNYFWNLAEGASKDASKTVSADWFESVETHMDYNTHVYSQKPVTRNADGTINMNGLLVLTNKADANTGARLNEETLTKSAEITVSGEETSGLIGEMGKTYKILDGDGQTVVAGDKIVVRSEADFNSFLKVLVDGVEVAADNYTVTEGSTIVTFNEDFSKTLALGTHTIEIVSLDGSAVATINLVKANESKNSEIAADTDTVIDNTKTNEGMEVAADTSNVANTAKEEVAADTTKTGDNAVTIPYILMLMAAGILLVASRKKKIA